MIVDVTTLKLITGMITRRNEAGKVGTTQKAKGGVKDQAYGNQRSFFDAVTGGGNENRKSIYG